MTELPLWPQPPRRPGSRIRHSWRCTRSEGIEQATRRTPDGVIIEVERCAECQADDMAERLLATLDGDDAA